MKNLYDRLEELVFSGLTDIETKKEIDSLTNKIEEIDSKNIISIDINPVELLKIFLRDHDITANELEFKLNILPSTITNIINNKIDFSPEIVTKLSKYFKVSPEAFDKK